MAQSLMLHNTRAKGPRQTARRGGENKENARADYRIQKLLVDAVLLKKSTNSVAVLQWLATTHPLLAKRWD